ncbi:nucleotidyltransferase family protein [Geobacter sp. DSM 9736]|uniref:nucleotidyltransferase family protein n=1 Tax=Geobacter sp. DSM 9736 TaxID=1277350 RepID=UPI000B502E30|nr:nucleotidyltransferase domain-containing protein [Geobacter sp. DSM 9736]SNB46502.1 Nucleotidyltransferase domain-containing protein [Geobacter sp. DSM 9736]
MHIDPADLETILKILRSHIPCYEVWAFGSRVHGRNLKRFSDLDLVIIADGFLDPLEFTDLKKALSRSDLPFMIHAFNWFTLGKLFRRIIEAEHEVIQRTVTG